MKQLNFCFIITVFCVSSIAAETLRCYDCDPNPEHDGDKCTDPQNLNARLTICDATKGETMCLSAYYIGKGDKKNQTGVYRGCFAPKSDVKDQCGYFKEKNRQENLDIVSCLSCTDARCNVQLFDDNGSPKNSVSKNVSSILFISIINILFISLSLLLRS
ncbi:unnamed protein product [Callosobruchus maculatus]|uniref:Protein sleepless n=1 Tax=Callosobruchus maculatus TaxID=64391 RepID=A0A653BTZ3_CALMS|nr:unnamed protein product [Callosobruchus maculatus]